MASEDRSLSEFPRALEVLSDCLLMISNPDGLGGYDTNSALLTEVGRTILGVQYTQQLGNVSVFDAIKNTRVLSGTTTPTANEGANGQLYVKYETVSNVDSVVGMYFKKDGAWLEISLGGGGNTDYIECTQAQYDAWEQGGTLDPDTLYFITDGNIGNDIIDDSTASETTVYSSDKVEDLLSDKLDKSDFDITKAELISPYLQDSMYFFRQGNVCLIECQTILAQGVTIPAGGTLDLFTIQNLNNYPETLKASSLFISSGLVGMVRIDNTTGKITLYNQSGSAIGANGAINFSLAYMAKIN